MKAFLRTRHAATFAAVCAGVLLTGCPRGSSQQSLSSLPSLTTNDPQAEAELRVARDAAREGRDDDAERGFQAFLREHPSDPLVPIAQLGLGRVLLSRMEVEPALTLFVEVARSNDPAVAEAGRFYQGVTLQLAGRPEQAIALLEPLVGRTTDPEETALLLRTLSAAAQRTERPVLALSSLDQLARAESVAEEERESAHADIRSLVADSDAEAVQVAYAELPRDGVAWPEVAVRAIRLAFDAGDMARVSEIVAELRAREIPMTDELAELAVRAERTSRADPRVIGAIMPITGPGRAIGQRAVRGLMLASGAPSSEPPGPDTPQLVMRDDGGDATRAAAAVEDLVSEHRAIAIIGPLQGAGARAAARRAQELGIPLIALAPDASVTEAGPLVFRLFPSAQDEAQALVARARQRGAMRFAVLRPDHGYGRAMAAAFTQAVQAAGGELVHTAQYSAGATSFGEVVSGLESHAFDALFVPDDARAVTLIAPALAAAGLWSVEAGASPPRGGRAITLLLPSVSLDPRVRGSQRYLQGAVFAAPFHAASATGSGREFVDAFTARFEAPPDVFAAHAYDAFVLVRRAVAAGETTRAGVARWLAEHGRGPTVTASGGLDERRRPAAGSGVIEMTGADFRRP